jgi:hypothetical protein
MFTLFMKELFFFKVPDLAKPTICSLKTIELKVEKVLFSKKSKWEEYSCKNVVQSISYQAFKHLHQYSNEKLRYVQTYTIFYSKAFDIMNLHYEIRICQKIYNRVTTHNGPTHNKSKCLVRNSLHQTY